MPILRAQQIGLNFEQNPIAILEDIQLEVAEGELTVILGESGCGKTSLLNILAGFQAPSRGVVKIDHDTVSGPDARRAVVFQEHALMPWLNVAENVAFALKLKGINAAQTQQHVDNILKIVGLSHVATANIWQLSGGMKQRVGIARALMSHANFILLDEPFAALDAFTRESMQQLVLDLWIAQGKGFFLITHDIEEALLLGQQLVLMSARPGRIVQTLRLDFAERYRNGQSIRQIKSDPEFIALRERLFEQLSATQQQQREVLQ
ncbi:taurine ABC transporter ATP-binding protein [Acinetobacter larvae]|uniref:Taurine transporter ATP-binding subunit n=1 Tax=Acinetobacter larvae TaxID=1789224 RepID=A0A1B2LY39_9GAMM|nr:ATP-binding cassette domain-containing protein [Acinetobacter larvae]AOA57868.1 taurine transporter ATP-binding subunit [Acinetobacter larvae]